VFSQGQLRSLVLGVNDGTITPGQAERIISEWRPDFSETAVCDLVDLDQLNARHATVGSAMRQLLHGLGKQPYSDRIIACGRAAIA
jgi:hypothetical protein